MKKIGLLLAVVLLAVACGQNNKAAFEQIEQAKQHYNNQEYSSARDILDSLKIAYPEELEVQRARLDLSFQVDYAEAKRNVSYADSLIPIKQAELEQMLPLFNKEKNPELEDLARYIDKAYNPSLDKENSFVKATVNETGEIALVSAYKGKAIKHTQIKVSDPDGNYVETAVIPQDGGVNYSFNDRFGTTYETITFMKGRDNGVIMFLYNYADKRLTVERLGGVKASPVVISEAEKQSIKRMADLSMVLRELDELSKEQEKSTKRIEYLEAKVAK